MKKEPEGSILFSQAQDELDDFLFGGADED